MRWAEGLQCLAADRETGEGTGRARTRFLPPGYDARGKSTPRNLVRPSKNDERRQYEMSPWAFLMEGTSGRPVGGGCLAEPKNYQNKTYRGTVEKRCKDRV